MDVEGIDRGQLNNRKCVRSARENQDKSQSRQSSFLAEIRKQHLSDTNKARYGFGQPVAFLVAVPNEAE
jgi:hypothetical protein